MSEPEKSTGPNQATVDPAIESLTQQERKQAVIDHPLRTGAVLLPTPPINELFSAMNQRVLTGVPGACFTAPSGAGKSSALKAVAKELQATYPRMLVIEHSVQSQVETSSRGFSRNLLDELGHTTQMHPRDVDLLRTKVTNLIADHARAKGAGDALLLLDEAQSLAIADYRFLKDVFNKLARLDIKLTTFMMAQEPQFSNNRTGIKLVNETDLIARFMMHTCAFRPLSSVADLLAIFEGIDSEEFPAGSGITWTGFYLPKAFNGGFRLSTQVDFVMHELKISKPINAETLEIPARQLFGAILSFFMSMSVYDHTNLTPKSSDWIAAMKSANLVGAMAQMNRDYKDRSPIVTA